MLSRGPISSKRCAPISRGVHIRPAESGDLSAILEILNQAIEDQKIAYLQVQEEKDRRAWFAKQCSASPPLCVVQVDEELCGFAYLSSYRPGREALKHVAEISYFIHRDHHRRGLAQALIQWLEERAFSAGIKVLLAILLEDNGPSRALLDKVGFRLWGEFPQIARMGTAITGQVVYGKHIKVGT